MSREVTPITQYELVEFAIPIVNVPEAQTPKTQLKFDFGEVGRQLGYQGTWSRE